MASDDLDLDAIMDEIIDDPSETADVTEAAVDVTEATAEMFTEELDQDNENDINADNQAAKAKLSKAKVCELPLSKIKGIMKMDPEVVMVGSEAVFAVAKAAELFIQTLAKQSYKHTAAQKKKTVQRSHVDSAVTGSDGLFFLEDALD